MKLRGYLAPEGRIFIKENLIEDGDTDIVEGEYEHGRDLSLLRSADCFRYIFQKASYSYITFDKWRPSDRIYPILVTCLKPEVLLKAPRHKYCVGEKAPAEWTSDEAEEKQEQQEEVKMPASTDTAEESVIEVKVQDAEAKETVEDAEMIQIYAEAALPRANGLCILRDADIFTGEVTHAPKKVEKKKQHAKA